jgi:DNA helicase-2/ATP-dependent DNA helicase PcrA
MPDGVGCCYCVGAAMSGAEAIDWDAVTEPEPAAPPPPREWSPMQQAIFDFVATGKGHGVAEALAGTGKSTTIEEAIRRAPGDASILACAFNKSIATALQRRLDGVGVDVLTLHSLGLRAVTKSHGRREVDGRYVGALVREAIFDRDAATATRKLIGYAKGCLIDDAEALDAALDELGIDVEPRNRRAIVAATVRILAKCGNATKGPIDFDDMIWLPAAQGMSVPRYEYVFVDETQDLNPAQLWLARAACAEGGRIIAVGDRHQSIYAFRGADRDAIPRMIRELRATVLPLSITYRCARAIVAEANRYVPALQAAAGAPDGMVKHVNEAQLEAQPGDMVLSRLNAPLVKLAMQWLGRGIRCRIQGRNIGEGLVKLLQLLGKKAGGNGVAQLLQSLRRWHEAERARLVAAERDTQETDDKAACVEALCEGCATVAQVIDAADQLFADDGEEGILLSSTHRAKGLEADRVWLLWDTYRPRADEQERNLCYVAITRAKRELYFAHGEGSPEDRH